MPKLLCARPPQDATEERQVRQLARSRHAPADWMRRAQMIVRSWDGERTSAIAAAVGCHPQTVRERLGRFNIEGVDGFTDQAGAGRKPRLTEGERSTIIGVVATTPPGKLMRDGTGALESADATAAAHWTLNTLTSAAHQRGITVARSQVRRILLAEQVRWRQPRSWTTSADPEFAPKGKRSSRSTPAHPKA
jgi:transposase